MVEITLAEHENEYELYIVLLLIIFSINIGIGTFFVYCIHMNHDKKMFLKKIWFFKQQLTEHIKMTVKSINIKNEHITF